MNISEKGALTGELSSGRWATMFPPVCLFIFSAEWATEVGTQLGQLCRSQHSLFIVCSLLVDLKIVTIVTSVCFFSSDPLL